jgi:hypothetical protein
MPQTQRGDERIDCVLRMSGSIHTLRGCSGFHSRRGLHSPLSRFCGERRRDEEEEEEEEKQQGDRGCEEQEGGAKGVCEGRRRRER